MERSRLELATVGVSLVFALSTGLSACAGSDGGAARDGGTDAHDARANGVGGSGTGGSTVAGTGGIAGVGGMPSGIGGASGAGSGGAPAGMGGASGIGGTGGDDGMGGTDGGADTPDETGGTDGGRDDNTSSEGGAESGGTDGDGGECPQPLPFSDGNSVGQLYTFDLGTGNNGWASPAGTVAVVDDDAFSVACRPVRGALQFTTAFTALGQNGFVRVIGARDWTGRTRVHLSVKVTSGLASMSAAHAFMTDAANTQPTQANGELTPASTLADGLFHELTLELAAIPYLATIGRVGVEVRGAPADPDAGVPPQVTIEVDHVWLE